jgi:hypothetical protein
MNLIIIPRVHFILNDNDCQLSVRVFCDMFMNSKKFKLYGNSLPLVFPISSVYIDFYFYLLFITFPILSPSYLHTQLRFFSSEIR